MFFHVPAGHVVVIRVGLLVGDVGLFVGFALGTLEGLSVAHGVLEFPSWSYVSFGHSSHVVAPASPSVSVW